MVPAVACWSDDNLGGGWTARARYPAHQFDRHLHDEMVIVVTESGWGEVRTKDGAHSCGAGSVWVCAPGEFHCGRVSEDQHWSYRAIYLDNKALSWVGGVYADDPGELLRLRPALYPDVGLSQLLLSAHDRLECGSFSMEREAAWHTAFQFMIRRYGHFHRPAERGVAGRAKMAPARDFLHDNYNREITVHELAALTGLSRFHFMRSFRQEFGLPPHAYANQLRLIAAKQHLSQGLQPADVAVAVGFYDQSHLTRMFKRAYGITPAAYAYLRTKHNGVQPHA
jgi:AraC-like DNA-binding protein